jgi:hypothetical protein
MNAALFSATPNERLDFDQPKHDKTSLDSWIRLGSFSKRRTTSGTMRPSKLVVGLLMRT